MARRKMNLISQEFNNGLNKASFKAFFLKETYNERNYNMNHSTSNNYTAYNCRSYKIAVKSNYICLHLKKKNTFEYFSFSPELLKTLLTEHYLYFYLKKDRTYAKIQFSKHKQYSLSLGQLAYAHYHGMITAEKFFDQLPFLSFGDDMEVDHLNNDIHNHCSWNLTLTLSELNKRKGTICAQILPPYFFYIAADSDSAYRIDAGYKRGSLEQHFYIKCTNIEMLMACADSFRRAGGWHGTPAFLLRKARFLNRIFKRKTLHAASDFTKAALRAESLLAKDESEFLIWTEQDSFRIIDEFSKLREGLPMTPTAELAKRFGWDKDN